MRFPGHDFPPDGLSGSHLIIRELTMDDLNRYVHHLLASDWESSDSALQLANLRPEEVKQTLFVDQTRNFLQIIAENGEVGLTPNGWLKLAVVGQLLERMEWARRDIELMRSVLKRISEHDVKPIRVIRCVCEMAGLVRQRRGRLYIPKRVLPLLAEEQVGRLYRELFLALYRRMNLGALYGADESALLLQESMAVVLWRLHIIGNRWIEVAALPDELLLGRVRADIFAAEPSYPELALSLLWHRAIEPLVWFGLLDCDQDTERRWLSNLAEIKVRKTPLFDRFIRFLPVLPEPPVEAS